MILKKKENMKAEEKPKRNIYMAWTSQKGPPTDE